MIDLTIFKSNLAFTQQYCDQQLLKTGENFAAIFRSINPLYEGDPLFTYSFWSSASAPAYNTFLTVWQQDPIDTPHLMEWLFDIQHNIKQQQPLQIKDIARGRILVFRVEETLIDGAAAVQTSGLIDDYNCPPVDTWFYLHRESNGNRVLFAWIPEVFVKFVDEGIDVNPEDCIGWFDVWYPEWWQIALVQ